MQSPGFEPLTPQKNSINIQNFVFNPLKKIVLLVSDTFSFSMFKNQICRWKIYRNLKCLQRLKITTTKNANEKITGTKKCDIFVRTYIFFIFIWIKNIFNPKKFRQVGLQEFIRVRTYYKTQLVIT